MKYFLVVLIMRETQLSQEVKIAHVKYGNLCFLRIFYLF